MKTQSVYALCDPRTGDIRYIGKAVDIHKRYAQHLVNKEDNQAKVAWMNELKSLYMFPTMIILEKNIEEGSILQREMYWIAYYLVQGANLLNVVVPGRAPNGHGKPEPYRVLNAKPAKKAPAPVQITEPAQPAITQVIEEPAIVEMKTYTLAEVAKRFDVRENAIKLHIKRGQMNASIGPDGLVITQEDIDNFLAWAREEARREIDARIQRRKQRQQSAS